MKIAIITGASSGMGREFVYALDADEEFDELWVIARRRERLEALQEQTRARVRVMALDLLDERSFDVVAETLAAEQPEVAVLVNAAGFGVFGAFAERDLHRQLNMIDLNSRALTAMCHLCLPYLKEAAGSITWAACPRGSRCRISTSTARRRRMC